MPETEEKYIYKSLRSFTLGLVPGRRMMVMDGAGNSSWSAATKGTKISFTAGMFEVNKDTASNIFKADGTPYTPKELKQVLESQPQFKNGKYKLVFDSTEGPPSEEQVEFSKKSEALHSRRGVKVSQGARAKK